MEEFLRSYQLPQTREGGRRVEVKQMEIDLDRGGTQESAGPIAYYGTT